METDEAYFLVRKKLDVVRCECLKLCLENWGNEHLLAHRTETTEGKAGAVSYWKFFLSKFGKIQAQISVFHCVRLQTGT